MCSCHSRDQLHDVEVGFDDDGRILALRDRFHRRLRRVESDRRRRGLQHRRPPARPLQDRRLAIECQDRRDQQGAERALPRSRPSGSRLRHGADHRPRRRCARPRARRGAPAQHDPRRRDALSRRHSLSRRRADRLRQRRLSGRAAQGASRDRRHRRHFARASAPRATQGRHLGLGIGCYVEGTGVGPFESADGADRSVRQDLRVGRRLPAGPGHGDDLFAGRGRRLVRSSPTMWSCRSPTRRPSRSGSAPSPAAAP